MRFTPFSPTPLETFFIVLVASWLLTALIMKMEKNEHLSWLKLELVKRNGIVLVFMRAGGCMIDSFSRTRKLVFRRWGSEPNGEIFSKVS